MLLRSVYFWSVLLLCLGGVVALAQPNQLTSEFTQCVLGQQCEEQREQLSMQKLNFTDQQKQQLHTIQLKYRGQIIQQRQKLLQAQQELSDLMAGTASPSQIRDKYRKVEALRQQMGELQLESMLAMREVMTSTQRRRFAQLMKQRKENFRDRTEGGAAEGDRTSY